MQARNFSAHGLYAGDSIDYEEQFMTSQVYECILVRVILKLLKYEGNYIDYGTIGYPERTLTVQAEVKLVKPLVVRIPILLPILLLTGSNNLLNLALICHNLHFQSISS